MYFKHFVGGVGVAQFKDKSVAESETPKSLGFITLVALVIANMIGVGVFTSSGYSLATLGNPGRVMLAWSLCGVWAICGAIAYGGLVSRLPQSGGEYLFLSRFVHPSIGFLAGWISLVAGFSAPIAVSAKNAAVHILQDAQSTDLRVAIFAAAIILFATLCHLAGVRIGAGAQNSIVAAKLALMLWLVIVAFVLTSADKWQGGALPGRDPDWMPPDFSAWWILAGSMSWLALSYTGFNAAIYVAGESRDAKRLVPRSMVVGTLLVMVIYLLLNTIFVYFPKPELLLGSGGFGEEQVAAVAAKELGGESLGTMMRLIIVLSTCSSVWAMLMMGPRVYRQMSEDGVFPSFFKDASYKKTLLLQCVLSAVGCFAGSILDLMTYLGLTLSACGALAVGSLLWIRRTLPDSRPLSVVEAIAAVVYLSMTAILVVATSQQRPGQFWAMLATFFIGILTFVAWKLRSPSRPNFVE